MPQIEYGRHEWFLRFAWRDDVCERIEKQFAGILSMTRQYQQHFNEMNFDIDKISKGIFCTSTPQHAPAAKAKTAKSRVGGPNVTAGMDEEADA
jgi:hypothetical protein